MLVGQTDQRDNRSNRGDYKKCKIHSVYAFLEKVADLKDTSFLDSIRLQTNDLNINKKEL